MSTASSVPIWITAVKAAPGSPQPKSSGKIRRCALLEIGRNSVSPWMTPRTMALRRSHTAQEPTGTRLRRAGGPAVAGIDDVTQAWPEEIRMSEAVRERVTRRWKEYGL